MKMIKYKAIAFLAAISLASARPSVDKAPLNMVTVPTNCPEGQQLVNGVCRDIWRLYQNAEASEQYIKDKHPLNMITVPQNCPPGQELVNGVCREIWRSLPTSPMPAIPKNTDDNYLKELIESFKSMINNRAKRQVEAEELLDLLDRANTDRNIISVPNQCPSGSKPDILGICRPIFN